MSYIVSELESGMRFAFRHTASPVANCALSIKVGTRDEDSRLNGLAHFTEHMLFKGTLKRRASSINSCLEKLGGELNAYTTKEETVIHATVLREDLPKAIELLADLAINSQFPQKEIIKERGVILEEISSYKDSPSELIYDEFEELLFAGHPLAMPILGTPKTIKKIGSEELMQYTKSHFIAPNMCLSIVADITPERGLKLVNRYFSEVNGESVSSLKRGGEYIFPSVSAEQRERAVSKKTFQAHCIVGARGYSLYHPLRIPLALITNVLGGPALNSRLNVELRERHALAYSVEASYTPYSDTGVFSVYFGSDKASAERCLSLVHRQFRALSSNGLSEAQLKAAKKQLLGQLAISSDNAEAQCQNMGKSVLVYNRVEPIRDIRSKIEAITSEEILSAASEILNDNSLYTIIYR